LVNLVTDPQNVLGSIAPRPSPVRPDPDRIGTPLRPVPEERPRRARRTELREVAVGLAVCSLVAGGCFSGEYSRRMDVTMKRLGELGELAAVIYAQQSPIQDLAGNPTGISLRLPLFIGDARSFRADDADAQPSFLSLPGLAYGYEMDFGGQKAYAYFASVPVEEQDAEGLAQELQAAVRKTSSSAAWSDVSLKTPDGGTVRLRMLSTLGTQRFGTESQEGRFDLYLVSSPTHHVLLGWRAPTAAAGPQRFFEQVAASMGSIQGAG
jgi:hypothetical protein